MFAYERPSSERSQSDPIYGSAQYPQSLSSASTKPLPRTLSKSSLSNQGKALSSASSLFESHDPSGFSFGPPTNIMQNTITMQSMPSTPGLQFQKDVDSSPIYNDKLPNQTSSLAFDSKKSSQSFEGSKGGLSIPTAPGVKYAPPKTLTEPRQATTNQVELPYQNSKPVTMSAVADRIPTPHGYIPTQQVSTKQSASISPTPISLSNISGPPVVPGISMPPQSSTTLAMSAHPIGQLQNAPIPPINSNPQASVNVFNPPTINLPQKSGPPVVPMTASAPPIMPGVVPQKIPNSQFSTNNPMPPYPPSSNSSVSLGTLSQPPTMPNIAVLNPMAPPSMPGITPSFNNRQSNYDAKEKVPTGSGEALSTSFQVPHRALPGQGPHQAIPAFIQQSIPSSSVPPSTVPPSAVPFSAVPPSALPPTAVPFSAMPPSAIPPSAIPPNAVPSKSNHNQASSTLRNHQVSSSQPENADSLDSVNTFPSATSKIPGVRGSRNIHPSRGCPIVSFGFSGKVCVMIPQVTQPLRPMIPGSVIVYKLADILKNTLKESLADESTVAEENLHESVEKVVTSKVVFDKEYAEELNCFFNLLESFPGLSKLFRGINLPHVLTTFRMDFL